MKIQSNYNSYSGTGYEHNHTHHITKCLHEEKQEQHNGGAAGIKADSLSMGNPGESMKQETAYIQEEEQQHPVSKKKGMGLLKNIWDSMGDEGEEARQGAFSSGSSPMGAKGIEALTSAMKQVFPYRIINKWKSVREKIKVGVNTALKRFGKGSTAFGALTDPRGHFTGKKETDKQLEESKEKGTRQKADPVSTVPLADSHLMDSYSKTGAYCRLNENLTYQKKVLPQSHETNL